MIQADTVLRQIEALDEGGTLPIVVGGTMYFIQHLLLPGNLVSAEDAQSGPIANPKTLEDLPVWLRDAVSSFPTPLLDVLFVIQDLPNISSPEAFAADFPINRLPPDYREGEKLSMGLHTILHSIDPTMATRWHWRDIRKVRRSVEVALQTGKPHSQIIAEQKDVPSEAECVSPGQVLRPKS
jgi:tRNA dimethylallyltransferase